MKSIRLLILIGCFAYLTTGCEEGDSKNNVNFDREAFLVNMSDNLIDPAIKDYAAKADGLVSAFATFNGEVSEQNLVSLRNALKSSWLSYQYLAYLHVGPVQSVNLRDRVNIFPANTTVIESNIASQSYILGAASNVAAKGYPAIDYLLFGTGEDEKAILNYFSDSDQGENRRKYLQDVIADINAVATTMADGWADYRSFFVGNTGTDAGSGTSLLVNEYNFQFDIRLKNAKIGFPAGGNPRTGGVLSPERVEAYYSGWSSDLAEASVTASLKVFKGETFQAGENGLGLDDYLLALNAKTREEQDLSEAIINKTTVALEEMQKIEDPYSVVAATEGSQLVVVYNALQAVIPLIKVDMTSAMSVSITFQDNDGD